GAAVGGDPAAELRVGAHEAPTGAGGVVPLVDPAAVDQQAHGRSPRMRCPKDAPGKVDAALRLRAVAFQPASVDADVLVPERRIGPDPVRHHADTGLVGEVDHLHAVFAQPVVPALEIHRIAHHHGTDAELAHQAAAVPAGRERGDHDGVAVGALAAGLAEGVGFAVHRRVVLLHAAVAA